MARTKAVRSGPLRGWIVIGRVHNTATEIARDSLLAQIRDGLRGTHLSGGTYRVTIESVPQPSKER